MKTIFVALSMVLFIITTWCGCSPRYTAIRHPERPNTPLEHQPAFKPNELLVMFKKPPTSQQVRIMQRTLYPRIDESDTNFIREQRCNSCSGWVEKWMAPDIHTRIHTEGLTPGSGGSTKGVGEDSLAWYSLNYINRIPADTMPTIAFMPQAKTPPVNGMGRDTIVIAVLDTGIDTVRWVHNGHIWLNKREFPDRVHDTDGCYQGDLNGWNFVNDNNNIYDDNLTRHGSLVSQYIVNEFRTAPKNFLQLMPLKTHNANGYSDLFSIICAIHYAIDKKANIINASWGFYYYYNQPHPYLSHLITESLSNKGILFVTAAGNKIPEVDSVARIIYASTHAGVMYPENLLRNLEYHNFYPACLSNAANNVITVTTTDGNTVSPTQNYSSLFVDLGVMRDVADGRLMKFQLPYPGSRELVSGSSFATAIACGKIGAWFSYAEYGPGINKNKVFLNLQTMEGRDDIPNIVDTSRLLRTRLIRDGKFMERIR